MPQSIFSDPYIARFVIKLVATSIYAESLATSVTAARLSTRLSLAFCVGILLSTVEFIGTFMNVCCDLNLLLSITVMFSWSWMELWEI